VWTSPITFDKPALLLILPAALLAAWLLNLRSRVEVNSVSRRQVLWIRLVTIILIAISFAGIRWHRFSNHLSTIFVVDMSDSVSPSARQATLQFINHSLASKRSGDHVGLLVFGKEPFLEFPLSSTLDINQVRTAVPTDGTDIESALEAAAGDLPADTGKRIVLCSDGLENMGQAESSINALKAQGVQVDISPTMLSRSDRPEASVDRLVVPAHTAVNTPLRIRTVLSTNTAQKATLTISRDGKAIDRVQVTLDQGKSAYYFDDRLSNAGLHTYTAHIDPTVDTLPQNNDVSSAVMASGAPRVLVIRNSNEPIPSAVEPALRAQGLNVEEEPPSFVPQSAAGAIGYDSILLSDVAASDLSTTQMTALKEANSSFGVGLGMIGGVNSFGSGGYAGSPIEDALPVLMTPKGTDRIPAADVVIVLDASGSMAAEEGGVEKVEIAARAALNLLGALQPKDRVAVLAVTETATIVMPLVSPKDSAKYVSSIEAVEAGGGGIDCRNGLSAAYTLLETSDAQIKHVIICPDTTDSEQKEGCVTLATSEYASAKITTSVCGIGDWSDPDVPFQKELAEAGHGQLFVANQAEHLPQFFKRDVRNVEQKLIAEGRFSAIISPRDPVVDIGTGFPPILGYNLVTPKADSLAPMTLSDHRDPLAAYWHDGIGKSFVFTGDDDAHWSRLWLGSASYPAFWAHLVRWSLKSTDDPSFQTLTTDINGEGHIVVDAFNDSGYEMDGRFTANVAAPDGTISQVALDETAPGRYEGTFNAAAVGGYLLDVRNGKTGGSRTDSITTSYSAEYADLPPDTRLLGHLASATGGLFIKTPSQAFRPEAAYNLGSVSLISPLLLLSAFLFLLDVAWRRFAWRLRSKTTAVAGKKAMEGAIVAAGSISKTITRPRPKGYNKPQSTEPVEQAEVNLLKYRTAARANMDDDDPFPYVATLPPRGRTDTIPDLPKEKK